MSALSVLWLSEILLTVLWLLSAAGSDRERRMESRETGAVSDVVRSCRGREAEEGWRRLLGTREIYLNINILQFFLQSPDQINTALLLILLLETLA